MPVEALLLPLRMPLFCSFEIIALVGCGIATASFFFGRFFSFFAFFDRLKNHFFSTATQISQV